MSSNPTIVSIDTITVEVIDNDGIFTKILKELLTIDMGQVFGFGMSMLFFAGKSAAGMTSTLAIFGSMMLGFFMWFLVIPWVFARLYHRFLS